MPTCSRGCIIGLLCLCIFSPGAYGKAFQSSNSDMQQYTIAHRGAWKKKSLPENSIASLKQAINLKCAGSEFDVRMTADDSLIINHDPHFNKLFIEKSSYSELASFRLSNGEKLPTLWEYLSAGAKNNPFTKLVCEIKPSEISKERGKLIATRVNRLVNDLDIKEKIIFISFDYDILRKLVELNSNAITQYLNGDKSPEQLKADGISGANYHYTVFQEHPDWIECAKKNAIVLNAWTVNDTAEMDWLLANNFDFITTNEPEILAERIRESPTANGWKLIWSDEFNYNGLPDSTKWNYETGGHGWGNNEKQYYLEKSLENSVVKNGILKIIAQKKEYKDLSYTSAKLTTYNKLKLQYGKIEVMAKLPKGKGNWPAIWMLPESLQKKEENWPLCGEIDIMEHVGNNPDVVHSSLHSQLYNHIKRTQITHFEKLRDLCESFHRYGIEWTKQGIKFFIDEKLFFETHKGENGRNTSNEGWPFDKPFYLILNLAIGGNWGGEIDDSIFPNEMQIDFVRIYQK